MADDTAQQIPVNLTLVAGLGGTGSTIATEAAKSIKASCEEVPFVRQLKLDTDDYEGDHSEEAAEDFINLQDHMNLPEVVQDFFANPDAYPHLEWMRGLRPDASLTKYGCRGIPRLGRLVFTHLRDKVIRQAVEARFQDLLDKQWMLAEGKVGRFCPASGGVPVIHVASSVCGGTGAGMLIDFAYNLRRWSEEMFGKPADIIAHLMLPEAFNVPQYLRTKLQAVAGVTLRQLEYLTDSRREPLVLPYREETYEFPSMVPPFTFIYLLTGNSRDRERLAGLAGRMIRTMVVEPGGQRIASEANNKQQDILGNLDPRNGHRQFLASYGLHAGTAAFTRRSAVVSTCSGLEEMADAAPGADYAEEVREQLGRDLDVAKLARNPVPPAKPNWQRTGQEATDADIINSIEKHVREVFLARARQAAEQRADKVAAPGKLAAALVGRAGKMIGRDVFIEKAEPLGHVAACLAAWKTQLDEWIDSHGSAHEDEAGDVIERAVGEIMASLPDGQARQYQSPKINEIIGTVFAKKRTGRETSYVEELAEACVRANVTKAARAARGRLASGDLALQAVAREARRRAGNHRPEADVQRAADHDYFTTPLTANITADVRNRTAAERFRRQRLLLPVLKEVVFACEEAEPADDAIRQQVGRFLDSRLKEDIQAFRDHAMTDEYDLFHSPPDGSSSARKDPYYTSVRQVYGRARAKISRSHEAHFGQPLEVSVIQHVGKTCVMGIISEGDQTGFREAFIDGDYERKTEIWLQVMRIEFGFCLESLSMYDPYVRSIGDYVGRMGLGHETALWLNHRWYWAYQKALGVYGQAHSDRDRARFHHDREISARIHDLLEAVAALGGACEADLLHLEDMKVGVKAAVLVGQTGRELGVATAEISSAPELDQTIAHLVRCNGLIGKLTSDLRALSSDRLPGPEFSRALALYQESYDRIFAWRREKEQQARAEGGAEDEGKPARRTQPPTVHDGSTSGKPKEGDKTQTDE